jgi:hypothetical protein
MNQFAFLTIPDTDGQYHIRLSYIKESAKLQVIVTGPSKLSKEIKNISTTAELSLETGEFVYLWPQPEALIEVRGGVAYDETPGEVPIYVTIKDYDDDYGDEEDDDEVSWTLYKGAGIPVNSQLQVEVWLRGGDVLSGKADIFDWTWDPGGETEKEDIIAYRILEE